MKSIIAFLALFNPLVSAFPQNLAGAIAQLEARGVPSTAQALQLSKQRTNCGPTPCLIFNGGDQFVSTTGKYAYASPKANQIRGESDVGRVVRSSAHAYQVLAQV